MSTQADNPPNPPAENVPPVALTLDDAIPGNVLGSFNGMLRALSKDLTAGLRRGELARRRIARRR